MPLDQELYSQEAPGFVSENDETLKSIGRVLKATQGGGVWVMDAGGADEIMEKLRSGLSSFEAVSGN